MPPAYGCWYSLSIEEKGSCVDPHNPKELKYSLLKTALAYKATGQVQAEWEDEVLPQLKKRFSKNGFRYALSDGVPIPDGILWKLYLVGKISDIANLKPTIVAEAVDENTAKLGCKALNSQKVGLSVLLRNYDIHWRLNNVRVRSNNDVGLDNMSAESSTSLCGVQAVLRSSFRDSLTVSTIGGAIIVDGKPYALTTAHPFSIDDRVASSDGTGQDAVDEINGSDHSDAVSQSDESDSDTTIKAQNQNPLIRLQSKVYIQECDPALIDPVDLSIHMQVIDEGAVLNHQSSIVLMNRNDDWALIPIENTKFQTTNHYISSEGESLLVTGITNEMPPGPLVAATGTSIFTKTTFRYKSMLLLPSSDKPQIVWVADMKTAPGDSGSWLIDEQGKACAMVVAASEDDDEAFCLPLEPVFESIRQSLKASTRPSIQVNAAERSISQSSRTSSHALHSSENQSLETDYTEEQYPTPTTQDPYASQIGFGQFPPPPGPMPQHAYTPSAAVDQQAYGPQDFPPPPPGAQQAQLNPYAPSQNPYAPRSRGDENASAAFSPVPLSRDKKGPNKGRQPTLEDVPSDDDVVTKPVDTHVTEHDVTGEVSTVKLPLTYHVNFHELSRLGYRYYVEDGYVVINAEKLTDEDLNLIIGKETLLPPEISADRVTKSDSDRPTGQNATEELNSGDRNRVQATSAKEQSARPGNTDTKSTSNRNRAAIQEAKTKLANLQVKAGIAERNRDIQTASDLQYYAIPEAKARIKTLESENSAEQSSFARDEQRLHTARARVVSPPLNRREGIRYGESEHIKRSDDDRNVLPAFLRDDYGRSSAGPIVLRTRSQPRIRSRPRALSHERESIVIRRDERDESRSLRREKSREREEIIIRRDETEFPPPPLRSGRRSPSREREEIIIRRDETDYQSVPPPSRRYRREESPEREEIIIRRDERERSRPDRQEIIIRRSSRSRSPSPAVEPPPLPQQDDEREEIIIRRDERERSRPVRLDNEREEIIIRRDERAFPPPPRRDEDEEIIIRREERNSYRPPPPPPPPDDIRDEIIIRREERDELRPLPSRRLWDRDRSSARDNDRNQIVIRRDTREQYPISDSRYDDRRYDYEYPRYDDSRSRYDDSRYDDSTYYEEYTRDTRDDHYPREYTTVKRYIVPDDDDVDVAGTDLEVSRYKTKLRNRMQNMGIPVDSVDHFLDTDDSTASSRRRRELQRENSARSSRYDRRQIAYHADWDRDPDRFSYSHIRGGNSDTRSSRAMPSQRLSSMYFAPSQMNGYILDEFGIDWHWEGRSICVEEHLSPREVEMLLELSKDDEGTNEAKSVATEVESDSTYPRKGKTRMPKRLVHSKVLFDLGYPFYEDDDGTTLVISKALGPDNIDEVFLKSKELFEKAAKSSSVLQDKDKTEPPDGGNQSASNATPPFSRDSASAKKKDAKRRSSSKDATKPIVPNATSAKEASRVPEPTEEKDSSRKSRPRSASRHRKPAGSQRAQKRTTENKPHVENDELSLAIQVKEQQDQIAAALQAEDLKYEADVQNLFWQQGLSVELCNQILQLHSEKEARFDALQKSKSDKAARNATSIQSSVQGQSNDIESGEQPTQSADPGLQPDPKEQAPETDQSQRTEKNAQTERSEDGGSSKPTGEEVVVDEDSEDVVEVVEEWEEKPKKRPRARPPSRNMSKKKPTPKKREAVRFEDEMPKMRRVPANAI